MRKGRIKKVRWSGYTTGKFTFPEEMDTAECGAYALHALTKEPYEKIVKLSKKGHWPNSTMFKFLKERGFEIIPITIGSVVASHSIKKGYKPQLTRKNVILIDQAMYLEENSWAVLYQHTLAHSGDISPVDSLEFLNWPIEAAYLINHPKWR